MCNRIKGVMVSHDYKPDYVTIVRIRCKMWGCPDCGPVNARSWRAYLLDRFNKVLRDEKWVFVTITAPSWAHKSVIASITALQRGWKKLYDHFLRRYGKEHCQYIRVFEPHKSGRFHMHALINCGAEYDAHGFLAENVNREFRHPENIWLKKACVKVKLGWRCHMRRVWDEKKGTSNVGLVVGYITKYMSKQMSDFEFPKHQRRISTSRAIGSPKKSAVGRGVWTPAREVPIAILKAGKRVLDMSTGEVLTYDSFEGEDYYPPLRFYRGDKTLLETGYALGATLKPFDLAEELGYDASND